MSNAFLCYRILWFALNHCITYFIKISSKISSLRYTNLLHKEICILSDSRIQWERCIVYSAHSDTHEFCYILVVQMPCPNLLCSLDIFQPDERWTNTQPKTWLTIKNCFFKIKLILWNHHYSWGTNARGLRE